ncbi:hypothetical protein F4780DRAFT_741546 [Xylariomycetidae sp. FL0641]|nr:hypothetical protein F4780DRAFT_741546 [Xylariomycetidae sp. FL0641]
MASRTSLVRNTDFLLLLSFDVCLPTFHHCLLHFLHHHHCHRCIGMPGTSRSVDKTTAARTCKRKSPFSGVTGTARPRRRRLKHGGSKNTRRRRRIWLQDHTHMYLAGDGEHDEHIKHGRRLAVERCFFLIFLHLSSSFLFMSPLHFRSDMVGVSDV